MPLFPNTLLAWAFTGNEFSLTCSVNNVSIIILLWGVRANFIDSHFSLSNSHSTFAGEEFFIHQLCKLRQGPETQTGFFLVLTVISSNTDALVGNISAVWQCGSMQGKKICTPFLNCLLIRIFVKKLHKMIWQLFYLLMASLQTTVEMVKCAQTSYIFTLQIIFPSITELT